MKLLMIKKVSLIINLNFNSIQNIVAHCKNWEEMIDQLSVTMMKSKDIVADYKAKMSAEELLSRKTKKK